VRITSSTLLYGIMGHPVAHSLSPPMQNAAFREVGIDAVYVAFDVEAAHLGKAIEGVRALGVRGLNVTIPHKERVIEFLDELDDVSREVGAVNTIINRAGRLKGYNTDGVGARRALEEAGVVVRGKVVLLLGAGGAARAIAFALAKEARKITVANRSAEKAARLKEDLKGRVEAEGGDLSHPFLARAVSEADIIVNCTKVGMLPDAEGSILDRSCLKAGQVVFDIVYNPLKTRLLREAEAARARAVDGVGMLVNQGAESFALWTGREAPTDLMRHVVLRELGAGVRAYGR